MAELLATYGRDVDAMCDACVAHLPGVSGVGVAAMAKAAATRIRYASNTASEQIEQLQIVLGEGPCVDAFAAGQPVLAADLGHNKWAQRWPVFLPEVLATGARALFAIPLQVGGARVGVMDLHRSDPGILAGEELADVLTFASATTQAMLIEAHDRDTPGTPSLDESDPPVVHQATGVVKVQLGVNIAEALVQLRAYASATGRPVEDVAREVVQRRLRFDELDA
ncbi:GAF domain-containing protein [Actinoplanes sp. OR16]|uniref:GAF and ANTAR domain-containing protein n=1 Tax=Actinoplanes sp. OR16 TaxID=946334 RepID=UPI000F70F65E|nr:GAF and ANTAR domain-containing protein [Actinoplanes sp. OR16]BBH65293.1 GAF domain-containing protein [Actinoplanes sp. OR16]